MFKTTFKYYKRKEPPPDLSEVIDFSGDNHQCQMKSFTVETALDYANVFGMKPLSEWKIFELDNHPGLLYIPNPFTSMGQRYWISRCLQDFTLKPYRLNLDAEGLLKTGENWWEVCKSDSSRFQTMIRKLRWATFGYHHNWDTKEYSEDCKCSVPEDLAALCQYVATFAGFKEFVPEAGIVNYYHMDSTLSGHTDHSEPNSDAPLISCSFGQSAVFLIGGHTIEERPTALLIHSGDIIVMSGYSRMCYHAVPKILHSDKFPWNECDTVCAKKLDCASEVDLGDCFTKRKYTFSNMHSKEKVVNEVSEKLNSLAVKGSKLCLTNILQTDIFSNVVWDPFSEYISTSRINVNVRQVLWESHQTL